mmetsp:Transcript_12103/g.28708  ORF Transcript_12103/g.28708 Transcript_12103/m.28708 type:complete len:220 (-) Transcript_12103:32-691(-)
MPVRCEYFVYLPAFPLQCSAGYFLALSAIFDRMLFTQSRRRDFAVSHRLAKSSTRASVSGSDDGGSSRCSRSSSSSTKIRSGTMIRLATQHSFPAAAPTSRMHDRGSIRAVVVAIISVKYSPDPISRSVSPLFFPPRSAGSSPPTSARTLVGEDRGQAEGIGVDGILSQTPRWCWWKVNESEMYRNEKVSTKWNRCERWNSIQDPNSGADSESRCGYLK